MSIAKRKIVIFDDDEDILDVCKFVFESAGWQVFTYIDVDDADKHVETHYPDVIIMDNWIPRAGGIVATQSIKNVPSLHDIPVIYFSANNDIRNLASQAGADAFLPKPFDINELGKTIYAVTGQPL